MKILQRNLKRTTDTFLFISHTTNVLLFKFRCIIYIDVRIIKEMVGSVASGTPYIKHRWIIKWIKILVLKVVDLIKFAVDMQNSARLLRVGHTYQSANVYINKLRLSHESLFVQRSLSTL